MDDGHTWPIRKPPADGPVLIMPELFDMTPEEWHALGKRVERDGIAPMSSADPKLDAELVARCRKLLDKPPCKEAAEVASKFLANRGIGDRPLPRPALIVPGVLSPEEWCRRASGHGAFLERLRQDYEATADFPVSGDEDEIGEP